MLKRFLCSCISRSLYNCHKLCIWLYFQKALHCGINESHALNIQERVCACVVGHFYLQQRPIFFVQLFIAFLVVCGSGTSGSNIFTGEQQRTMFKDSASWGCMQCICIKHAGMRQLACTHPCACHASSHNTPDTYRLLLHQMQGALLSVCYYEDAKLQPQLLLYLNIMNYFKIANSHLFGSLELL